MKNSNHHKKNKKNMMTKLKKEERDEETDPRLISCNEKLFKLVGNVKC
jgi:hypothetical protein